MSTAAPIPDPEADLRAKAVFDDIHATRQTASINHLWRHHAFDAMLQVPSDPVLDRG